MAAYIVGTGAHARVIADTCAALGRAVRCVELEELRRLYQEGDSVVVGIGDNHVRARVAQEIAALFPGCTFELAVHPSAVVSAGAQLGPGTVVMAGAVVNTGAVLGAHVIVNTRSSVDHDCRLADFSSTGPGAALGGRVKLGLGAAVAIGACVIQDCEIGEHTIVGAGSAVVRSLPARSLCYGVPARVIRAREPGEKYV